MRILQICGVPCWNLEVARLCCIHNAGLEFGWCWRPLRRHDDLIRLRIPGAGGQGPATGEGVQQPSGWPLLEAQSWPSGIGCLVDPVGLLLRSRVVLQCQPLQFPTPNPPWREGERERPGPSVSKQMEGKILWATEFAWQ